MPKQVNADPNQVRLRSLACQRCLSRCVPGRRYTHCSHTQSPRFYSCRCFQPEGQLSSTTEHTPYISSGISSNGSAAGVTTATQSPALGPPVDEEAAADGLCVGIADVEPDAAHSLLRRARCGRAAHVRLAPPWGHHTARHPPA